MIVTNSTPLIGLTRIGSLNILEKLYGRIHIADGVYEELVVKRKNKIGVEEIKKADWIIREQIKDSLASETLQTELDRGEAETIVLARELSADLVIVDEHKARRVCKHLRLKVIGTVGVLLDARRRGIIKEVRPFLDKLRSSQFWMNDDLYRYALKKENFL